MNTLITSFFFACLGFFVFLVVEGCRLERLPSRASDAGPEFMPGYKPAECHFCEKPETATRDILLCQFCFASVCRECASSCTGCKAKACPSYEFQDGLCDICYLCGPEDSK